MPGGTEAFPDLGIHCQHSDCHQLDFLPFKCDGCNKVFCLGHRSYKSHECPKSDHNSRKVIVCDVCSMSIETNGHDALDERSILRKHEESGDCDPRKKKKPVCPARRCKEVLTFSNTTTCKTCQVKFCLRHRFPEDHACKGVAATVAAASAGKTKGGRNDKFLEALASRNGKGCGKSGPLAAPPNSAPSVKAY